MNVWLLMRTNSLGTFAGVHSVWTTVDAALEHFKAGKWETTDNGIRMLRLEYAVFVLQPMKLNGDYSDPLHSCALAALRGDPMALDLMKDVLKC